MNPVTHTELTEILYHRQEAIAQQWRQSLEPVALHAIPTNDSLFTELTQQVITSLLASPTPFQAMRAIGTTLAQAVGQSPEILGRTQVLLTDQVVTGLSLAQAPSLKPRLAVLLGQVAAGFFTATAASTPAHRRTIDLLAQSESRLLTEMETMLIITRALVSEVDLKNLLEFIMAQAEHLTSADGAKVLLLSDDRQHLEIVRPGEPWARVEADAILSPTESLAGRALAARQVVISNAPLTDPDCAAVIKHMASIAPTALLCAPLIIKNRQLGVLVAWHEDQKIFDTRDHRLITMLADHAALAINNARLHLQGRQLAIANERQRIARELHDSVAQQIHGIGLAAQTAIRLLNPASESKAREPMEYAQNLARSALSEIRERVQNLHPSALSEKGLAEALKGLCDKLEKHHNFQITFTEDPNVVVPPDCQEDLYYIAREALSNIIRHAGASQVQVALSTHQRRVRLSITDNGVGFDPMLLSQAETVGLRNMQTRCELIGGTLSVKSAPGQGTSLMVEIPGP